MEVITFSQDQYFCLNFQTFTGENALNHILSSNSAGKILKMAIKSEPLELCTWNFWNFLSQGDYKLVNISRILKFLTLHGFNQFGWNDPFLNPLWMKIAVTPEPVMILILNLDQKLNLTRETRQRQKKLDNDITAANCDVIVIFLIYGQFGAIRKPDSGRMVYKIYIFTNSNLMCVYLRTKF